MKKIILFFFVVLYLNISSSTIAWESNVKIGCINENLEPCSSTESSSNISASNSDKDLDKKIKIIKKKKITKKKNNDIDEKKITKNKKITKKDIKKKKKKKIIKKNKEKKLVKKNKNFSLFKTSSIDSKVSYDIDRNISFDEFKDLVINYTENSEYPDISY